MNKGSVDDLARRVDELEKVINELQKKLKDVEGPKPAAWFYRARMFDSQNPASAGGETGARK